jgi:hypothetical protein
MLPQRALALIREYSNPLTRPNWRDGAPHSALLLESNHITNLNIGIQQFLTNMVWYKNNNRHDRIIYEMGERKFPGIIGSDTINYIQDYGEELLAFMLGKSYLHEEKYINFYYYTKNFLVETKKLKLIKYIVEEIHCYEWATSLKRDDMEECL